MVFIRYSEHSKCYVKYGEHPNVSMTKKDFYNVNFLEDEFPSIGEIKKVFKLYELQQDLQLFLVEMDDLNSHQPTKDGARPLPERNRGDLSAYRNQVCPQSSTTEKNQPNNECHPQFLNLEHAVSPHVQNLIPRRDRGSDSPRLGLVHLLGKGGRIARLDRQIMKVLGSEGVNMKEFLVDIFKSKGKSSYTLP